MAGDRRTSVAMIAKRHVFHLAGYDPIDIAGQHRRFRRELAKFAATWCVKADVSDMAGGEAAYWSISAQGPNWATETVFEPLDWHDIVATDIAAATPRLLWTGFLACADFIISGTVFRYFGASHRYALFFMVPFLYVLLFVAVSVGLVFAAVPAVAALLPDGGLVRGAAGCVAALTLFALLMRWPGRKLRVAQGLADWAFARDYMYGRRPDVAARLTAFRDRIVARSRATGADEILFVGHSLGAIFLVDVMARALANGLGDGAQLSVLTVGATIPKISLHPAGGFLRDAATRLAAAPGVFWAEYQARDDAISFYKFHPVALRPIDETGDVKPVVHRVQFHQMMKPETFRRHRFRYMRLHYQFVMANDRRAGYDYFMQVCGPLALEQIVRGPNGPAGWFAADGSVLASPQAKPQS